MVRLWPVLLLLFPALELYVLIRVGELVGALATVALVVLSTMAGLFLLQLRGARILSHFQRNMAAGNVPTAPVFDTLCLMAAGWLFVFPGFVSDFLALLLLMPFVRQGLVAFFRYRMRRSGFTASVHTQSRTTDEHGSTVWTCTTVTPDSPKPLENPSAPERPRSSVVIDCEVLQPEGEEEKKKDGRNSGGPHGG